MTQGEWVCEGSWGVGTWGVFAGGDAHGSQEFLPCVDTCVARGEMWAKNGMPWRTQAGSLRVGGSHKGVREPQGRVDEAPWVGTGA